MPQIAEESVEIEMLVPVSEQIVEDVDAAILRQEEWMLDQRLKIDGCVKTKKEDLEQYEKKASPRERRD